MWTGTDATHAEHIEKIKSRLYIGLQGDGRFVPGQLGMGLVEGWTEIKLMQDLKYLLDLLLTFVCFTG